MGKREGEWEKMRDMNKNKGGEKGEKMLKLEGQHGEKKRKRRGKLGEKEWKVRLRGGKWGES